MENLTPSLWNNYIYKKIKGIHENLDYEAALLRKIIIQLVVSNQLDYANRLVLKGVLSLAAATINPTSKENRWPEISFLKKFIINIIDLSLAESEDNVFYVKYPYVEKNRVVIKSNCPDKVTRDHLTKAFSDVIYYETINNTDLEELKNTSKKLNELI